MRRCSARNSQGGSAGRRSRWTGIRLGTQVIGVEHLAAVHRGPQDASVLVGQCHHGLLPTRALTQGEHPFGYPIIAALGSHHGRLRALDQQGAQVSVAAFGDGAQPVLAATGMLLWHQAEPGGELRATAELLKVAHCGNCRRSADGTDAAVSASCQT